MGSGISPDFKDISAGVVIFLFGMMSLEEGFRAFTGSLLENMLRRTRRLLPTVDNGKILMKCS